MKNKIVCHPKSFTFIIMVAMVLIFTILIFGTFNLMGRTDASWYHFLLLGLFSIIVLVLLLRIMFLYKIVQVEKNRLTVNYPLRFGTKEKFDLNNEILYWSAKEIQRGNRIYDYLEIQTMLGTIIKMNSAELTHVRQMRNLLYSKHAKLMK